MTYKFRRVAQLLLLVLASSATAQKGLIVRGSVLDITGAAVSGAQVRIQDKNGVSLGATHTGPNGDFTISGLPSGSASIVIPEQSGFAARTLPLSLRANMPDLKIVLSPQAANEEITVSADTQLTTDSASNQDTIAVTSTEMEKLPVFDQDYVAALTPFLDASSGASGGVTLIVDGVEMKSVGVSASAIQEVRINNDPYSTEFTRPGRGRIEITTKPGSPNFHGEANFIFRDAIFNAKITSPSPARLKHAASSKVISAVPSATTATPASSLRALAANATPLSSSMPCAVQPSFPESFAPMVSSIKTSWRPAQTRRRPCASHMIFRPPTACRLAITSSSTRRPTPA